MSVTLIDYDDENDVLYVNFHNPPLVADDTNRRGDIIFRSKEGQPIGATIMNYSRYKEVVQLLVNRVILNLKSEVKKENL